MGAVNDENTFLARMTNSVFGHRYCGALVVSINPFLTSAPGKDHFHHLRFKHRLWQRPSNCFKIVKVTNCMVRSTSSSINPKKTTCNYVFSYRFSFQLNALSSLCPYHPNHSKFHTFSTWNFLCVRIRYLLCWGFTCEYWKYKSHLIVILLG